MSKGHGACIIEIDIAVKNCRTIPDTLLSGHRFSVADVSKSAWMGSELLPRDYPSNLSNKYRMLFRLSDLPQDIAVTDLTKWLNDNLNDSWTFQQANWRFQTIDDLRRPWRNEPPVILVTESAADGVLIRLRFGWEPCRSIMPTK